ncbi:FecR family protein [Carboxylicivirga sp. M1479]|uniref:FecR family protein n=1 Tax=Carboxylicivirga sp. M1479 TaxID=2594476 RepID=UPI0011789578|nr:FecR domain-containing protein [Carboxylicivirga sp. M1479]TRX71472.1 DUF4974 domain-containing protein [Carboxylicivirga sp. M1479]
MTNNSDIDLLIFKYLSGEASVTELQDLKASMESDATLKKRFVEIRDIWNVSHPQDFDSSLAFDKFKQQIAEDGHKKLFEISSWVKWVGVAASLVVMLYIGKLITTINEPDLKYYSYQTGKGERQMIYLLDSTQVWLAAETKLTFNSDYNKGNREISLNGEAFFDVSHNKQMPFVVKTGQHNVRVLGTRFNLLARSSYPVIETILEEGKVQVDINDVNSQCLLKPGQKSVYDKEKQVLKVQEEVDMSVYTAVTKGQLVFKNESLLTLKKRLETWYGLSIEVSDEVSDLRFTGVIENESVEDVLDIMVMSNGIRYKSEQNVIVITAN